MTEPTLDRQCQGHHDTITSIDFSPTDKQIASASLDSTVMVWNHSINNKNSSNSKKHRAYRYEGHKDSVYDIQFSPNGQLLASCSRDRSIKLWIPNVKGEHTSWQAHTGAIRSINFSQNGTNLLSASDDKTIKIYSVHKQKFIRSYRGHQNWVRSAVFNPTESEGLLVSGSDDKTVKLWDQRTASCIHTFFEHGGFVNKVAFHPSGTCIASAGSDASVRIWDIRTHRLAQYYTIHGTAVNSVCFHPNGQWLMTAGSDATCKLLDVLEGRTVFTLHGHEGPATACAFNRTGDRLASGSVDEAVTIWHSNLDYYSVQGCDREKDEKIKEQENLANLKALKISQKDASRRLSQPVVRKSIVCKTSVKDGIIVQSKKNGKCTKTKKSDRENEQNLNNCATVHPIISHKPGSLFNAREKLTVNTEKIALIPQSNDALVAQNKYLSNTIDQLSRKMKLMEENLSNCMEELSKRKNEENLVMPDISTRNNIIEDVSIEELQSNKNRQNSSASQSIHLYHERDDTNSSLNITNVEGIESSSNLPLNTIDALIINDNKVDYSTDEMTHRDIVPIPQTINSEIILSNSSLNKSLVIQKDSPTGETEGGGITVSSIYKNLSHTNEINGQEDFLTTSLQPSNVEIEQSEIDEKFFNSFSERSRATASTMTNNEAQFLEEAETIRANALKSLTILRETLTDAVSSSISNIEISLGSKLSENN